MIRRLMLRSGSNKVSSGNRVEERNGGFCCKAHEIVFFIFANFLT